jgi:hypothetical protein
MPASQHLPFSKAIFDPSDRALAEFGLGFGLVGIAGVGVPMIWPDEKILGICFLAVGGIGFLLVLALAIKRICVQRGIPLSITLVYIGISLMFLGAFIGTIGIRMLDRPQAESAAPAEGPIKVQAIAFPVAHENGVRVAGLVWQKGYSRTEMQFSNPLNEPISDLDAIIRPEFPIIKSVATSDFSKCQIGPSFQFPAPTIIGQSAGGGMRVVADNAPDEDDGNIVITDSHRLYCDKLTARTAIHVVLATVVANHDVMGPMWQEQRRDPSFVDVFLRYQVGIKKHEETFRLTFL